MTTQNLEIHEDDDIIHVFFHKQKVGFPITAEDLLSAFHLWINTKKEMEEDNGN